MRNIEYYDKPGTAKEEIETPALLLNLEIMDFNIGKMADFFKPLPANLRPHFKTHKSPLISHIQISKGAKGITCQKLSEAEELVASGIEDVLIATPIVGDSKQKRLAFLAKDSDIIIPVDNTENLGSISRVANHVGVTIRVVIVVDVGLGRCGVSQSDAAIGLVRLADELPAIEFVGVMGYEGHAVFIIDRGERKRVTEKAMNKLTRIAEEIHEAGFEVRIVSAGATGTYDISGQFPGITEIQAGSYVFMDMRYGELELGFKPAITMLTSVISVHPKRAVIDVGRKALPIDFGYPRIVDQSGVEIETLAEEHGILSLNSEVKNIKLGSKLELIPAHVCSTVNANDVYHVIQDNQLAAVWPIARGKYR